MQHHYMCELVKDKELVIKEVLNVIILSDRMTKALTVDLFKKN